MFVQGLVIASPFLAAFVVYYFLRNFPSYVRRWKRGIFTSLGYDVGEDEWNPDFARALAVYRQYVDLHFHEPAIAIPNYELLWKKFSEAWQDEVVRTKARPNVSAVLQVARSRMNADQQTMKNHITLIAKIICQHHGGSSTECIL